ncbi:putative phosphatidate cytidylyltransferase [Aspergillus lucknowensis]|uniref:dolichol kinase n=1 Tax=Aspergillus lucknowensis TaxID=176173 RepID=A0ABR4L5S2_9EURO
MASSTSQEDEGRPPKTIQPDPDAAASRNFRSQSRSPHPYHRNGSIHHRTRTSSDSGTEADDESTGLLKGLPAPPLGSRRNPRPSWNGVADHDLWLPGLQRWPSLARSTSRSSRRSSIGDNETDIWELQDKIKTKRRVEIIRRAFEAGLLLSVGAVVLGEQSARSLAWVWKKELIAYSLTILGLYALYPLNRNGRLRLSRLSSFAIPTTFDPAPLLYPILIPVYVSLSLSNHRPSLVLPNILLALASIPHPVIPMHESVHGHSVVHWMVTLIPVIVSEQLSWGRIRPTPLSLRGHDSELLTLVFPLHQALIPTLDFLLSTSILPAELQLLTTALINLFLFAFSPQAEILKALLWLGSMCIFIFCRQVLHWEVSLARIPTWKFRRSPSGSSSPKSILNYLDHRICQKLSQAGSSEDPTSDSDSPDGHLTSTSRRTAHDSREKSPPESPVENAAVEDHIGKQTSATFEETERFAKVRTTPRGRRKRSMAPDLASFLSMTVPQVQVRKWLYAVYVYLSVLGIILGPVRKYVGERALQGEDPFGWALGYLLGNISWFRFWVITSSLESWIPIPPRLDNSLSNAFCHLGRVEHLRQAFFGEASTRLMITAYCLAVLITGIAIVVRLSTFAEVDTRRKVFHGTMVMMFLPTIYVDPAFCALAMALALAIFLLLDLFRASQLPPISRPLTYFLEPYVDGRDYRGPVIVSHIFLLVGCAVPLWLALADVPRTGDFPWRSWDVQSRDTSMVSGIICVGLGDAAASLIGRRFGRRKWFWGGGKSIEGSVAFAIAVTAGSVFAQGWLALGQWPVSGSGVPKRFSWITAMTKAVLAASGASATEAVLTGCNDNVVVPVVLWLLVRGLGR